MRDLLAVMKALADENRLRIVAALQGRELCLCQIVELLGLATSTVSRHASILQQARLVQSRRKAVGPTFDSMRTPSRKQQKQSLSWSGRLRVMHRFGRIRSGSDKY